MKSYPILYDLSEIDRLTTQSISLADEILPTLGKLANKCLEIGCGAGSNFPIVSQHNPALEYVGVDISDQAIQHAKAKYAGKNSNTRFMVNEGSQLPFESGSFDLVVFRLVLWGASNREAILKEAHRVLKPDGHIYCFEPDDQLVMTSPTKSAFESIMADWHRKVIQDGCDPFIGRKIPKYLVAAGFEMINVQFKLSSYDSTNPAAYRAAFENLWRIYTSKGPSFFSLLPESPKWLTALQEVSTCSVGDVLTEGYCIAVGTKKLPDQL